MTPDNSYGRKRRRALQCYNAAMARHMRRYNMGPIGAPGDGWLAYRQWLEERREVIVALRDSELARLNEQQRRKQNERKRERRGGGPVRGR